MPKSECKCYLKPRVLVTYDKKRYLDVVFSCTVCGGSGGTAGSVTHYHYCEFKGCNHDLQSDEHVDEYRDMCESATKLMENVDLASQINPLKIKEFMAKNETKKVQKLILEITGREIQFG